MRALIPMVAGLGVLLIYQGLVATPSKSVSRIGSRLRDLLDEAGMHAVTPFKFVGASATCAFLALVLVGGYTSSLFVSLIFAGAFAWAPVAFIRNQRARRRRRFREAWPDAIATIISGVRAGMSLPEACASIAERGPKDLRPGFRSFTATYRASGSFVTGLQRLRTDLSDPVADRVITALTLANEVGGTDFVRVLRTLGNFVREDLRIRREIEARWSWTVSAARVAAAAPWVVLLLMSTRPEAAAAYASPSGLTVIVVGAGATAIGYRLMLRAARLPEQRRLGS